MRLYVSDQVFEQDEYGSRSIKSRSLFHQQQVSEGKNVWIRSQFVHNALEDESDYFQLGQVDEFDFYTFRTSAPQSTSWTNFPTTSKPYNLFKYASFDIELSQDAVVWNR